MYLVAGKCLLRQRLRAHGMTQRQLADKIGMPETQLSDYRNDRKKMSLNTAITVAAALNCHVEDLYEIVQVPPKRSRNKE